MAEIRTPQEQRPLMFLFGDSITKYGSRMNPQGWIFLLDDFYDGRVDILNRGHSGYNTRWAKYLFPRYYKDIPSETRPSISFIFLGANDSVLPGERQYVPLDEFKQNLRDLVEGIQNPQGAPNRQGLRKVVLITPPPIHEESRLAHMIARNPSSKLDRKLENTKAYASAVMEVAGEMDGKHGIPVYAIDFFRSIEESGEPITEHLFDGLHLSSKGNHLLFQEILKLMKTIPDYNPDTMAWDYPHHSEVDAKNPASSFVH